MPGGETCKVIEKRIVCPTRRTSSMTTGAVRPNCDSNTPQSVYLLQADNWTCSQWSLFIVFCHT